MDRALLQHGTPGHPAPVQGLAVAHRGAERADGARGTSAFPSRRKIVAVNASQRRPDGIGESVEHRLELVGERLMTLSTSLVAVWYSSDSCSSRVRACTSSKRRTFSMAITAWSAKVSTSSICFS